MKVLMIVVCLCLLPAGALAQAASSCDAISATSNFFKDRFLGAMLREGRQSTLR